eukprot:scaffold271613_cov33-Prasinocladus_malaysianus.AAC.2
MSALFDPYIDAKDLIDAARQLHSVATSLQKNLAVLPSVGSVASNMRPRSRFGMSMNWSLAATKQLNICKDPIVSNAVKTSSATCSGLRTCTLR